MRRREAEEGAEVGLGPLMANVAATSTTDERPVNGTDSLAVFEWIEAWYNPRRRHSSIGDISPIDYEARFTPAAVAA